MTRTSWSVIAVVAGVGLLALSAWFDATVVAGAERTAAASFDPNAVTTVWVTGSLLVGGSCLAIGVLAWRSMAVVDVLYVLVGGLFVLLPWLESNLAVSVNGAPPALPQPIASGINELLFRTIGPLNGVGTLGGAMVIAGTASIANALWHPRTRLRSDVVSADPVHS